MESVAKSFHLEPLEGKSNKIFNDKFLPCEIFLDNVLISALGWCKCHYSLSLITVSMTFW